MRYILSLFLIVLFLSTTAQAQEKVNYWLMKVPPIKGATSLQREHDDESFTSTLSYDLSVKDHKTVYTTYRNFFKGKKWRDFLEEHPMTDKDWGGYHARILPDGTAEAGYGASWISPNKAFSVIVSLTLVDYDENIFKGKVKVQILPNSELFMSEESYQNEQELFSDPRDIFIAAKVFGKDIEDLYKFDFTKVPEKYKNEKVIIGYKKLVDSAKQKHKEFGDKYVDRAAIPGK